MKEQPLELVALDLSEAWAARPPRTEFVLPGLARGTVGNFIATGGTGKTFVMLSTAFGVGIGKDLGGLWGDDPVRGPAVFLSIEDPEAELKQRVWAIRDLMSEQERNVARRSVHILPGAGRRLSLAGPPMRGTIGTDLQVSPWFDAFSRYVIGLRPRLVVIDTLNRLLGGANENDGSAMGWVVGRIEELARIADCAIVLCHHVSKAALGAGTAGEAHAARGSSVITDNARWQCNLSVPTEKDKAFKAAFGDVREDARRQFVRLEFAKLNYGPPREGRWLHRTKEEGGILRWAGSTGGAPQPQTKRSARGQAGNTAPDADGADGQARVAAGGAAAKPARSCGPSRRKANPADDLKGLVVVQ